MNSRRPLADLADAFHQDWDEDYSSPNELIRDFKARVYPAGVPALVCDLDSILSSQATATRLSTEILTKNADEIRAWLNNPAQIVRKAFTSALSSADINNQPERTFKKSTQTYVQQLNIRTVLVKDSIRAIGFYVLTSFPTP